MPGRRWAGSPWLAGPSSSMSPAGSGTRCPASRRPALAADRLSGMFLALTFGAAVPVSVAFASWSTRAQSAQRRGLGASYALALGAVAVIMTARDAFTVLFGWETLTVAFYLLAGSERQQTGPAAAAQITFAVRQGQRGRAAGRPAAPGHQVALDPAGFVRPCPGGAARTTAEVLLLAGFAVKAGLVPFQIWLPRGYAAAPGPARAIMAGVCVNVAFYGMWRTLALIGRAPGWLTGTLLVLGALSALLGIAHAAVQNRLSRVIAYSSIENTGLIVTGFGVALTGAAVGDRRARRGRPAGRHAAGGRPHRGQVAAVHLVRRDRGRHRPRRPGGTARRARHTPWSGFGLAVGSVTLAGLPPTVGFRVRVVPARIPDAAVPGTRPRLPPGARPGRRRSRPHRRLRRRHLRPPRRPDRPGPRYRAWSGAGRVRLGWKSRSGGAGPRLPGHRGDHAAGNPGHRGRAVARRAGLADDAAR